MKRKVAIFDVDGTIFRSSLLIELVNVLIEHKVFPEEAHLEYQREYKDWINRQGTYEPYIDGVVKVFMKYITGADNEKVLNATKEVLTRYEDRTYKYTRDLFKKLKDEGYYLLVISHSPKFILEDFGKKHGFDKIYGKVCRPIT